MSLCVRAGLLYHRGPPRRHHTCCCQLTFRRLKVEHLSAATACAWKKKGACKLPSVDTGHALRRKDKRCDTLGDKRVSSGIECRSDIQSGPGVLQLKVILLLPLRGHSYCICCDLGPTSRWWCQGEGCLRMEEGEDLFSSG